MKFSAEECELLLAAPMLGPKVIERLEQIGINSLAALAASNVATITGTVADMLGRYLLEKQPAVE